MSTERRPLKFEDAAKWRRALDLRACSVGLSGASMRVWVVISDYTLGYCKPKERLTHGRIAREANVHPKSMPRAIRALVEAALITYVPGHGDPADQSDRGRNTFSVFEVVRVPNAIARGAAEDIGDGTAQTPRNGGGPPREATTSLPANLRGPSPQGGGVPPCETATSGPRNTATTDPATVRGNTGRTAREDENRKDDRREDNQGVVTSTGDLPAARTGLDPTPASPESSGADGAAETDLTLADSDTDASEDVLERRVGAATAWQAVDRFASIDGLPIDKRTWAALVTALDEMASQVSPNELLMGIGYWHEAKRGQWPQDAAECLTRALAGWDGALDGVNAFTPHDAVREGRSRARWDAMSKGEREQYIESPDYWRDGPEDPIRNVRGLERTGLDCLPDDPFDVPLDTWLGLKEDPIMALLGKTPDVVAPADSTEATPALVRVGQAAQPTERRVRSGAR